MNDFDKYRDLIMVTKLLSGEFFVSVVVPVNQNQFVIGFPMTLTVDGLVDGPWFDFTANRVFNLSPDDLLFCKSSSESITTQYLNAVTAIYDDSIAFMDSVLEEIASSREEAEDEYQPEPPKALATHTYH